jgi:hypothetical protein
MRCSVYFLLCFTYILLFVREVHSQITFVQPPPASSSHDYHQNPAYKYGSTISIHWTGEIPIHWTGNDPYIVKSLQLEVWGDSIDPQSVEAGYILGRAE